MPARSASPLPCPRPSGPPSRRAARTSVISRASSPRLATRGSGRWGCGARSATGSRGVNALGCLPRLSWSLGANAAAQPPARQALEVLEPAGPSLQLAWAYSNQSQLQMLDGHTEEAIRWGEQALALAGKLGDREVL